MSMSSKVWDRIAAAMVAALLPRVMAELVKAVEELVHMDLNQDGEIGFGKKGGV